MVVGIAIWSCYAACMVHMIQPKNIMAYLRLIPSIASSTTTRISITNATNIIAPTDPIISIIML